MEPIRFVLIGHVDHGKSTLAGHLLYKAGKFSEHDLEKTTKEAEGSKMSRWKWAFLLDTNGEERVRGKTHEFSVVPFRHDGSAFELIDTPGHSTFVRSMIQGIGLFPNVIAVLVVSAIPNECHSAFEKGMLKEQCILARASGILHLVVAINKMDAVEWKEENFDSVRNLLRPFLKSLRFKSVQYHPVSAYEGKGIDDVFQSLKSLAQEPPRQPSISTDSETAASTHRVNCKVLRCDNIITVGFQCIAHINGKEHEVTVTQIQGRKFIKSGSAVCAIEISFPNRFR